MCNTYTFYHLCGHTYLHTFISCTSAVDCAATANLSSPRRIPLPFSAPLSPPSPYNSTSRTTFSPREPLLTPPLPLRLPFPSPTTPSAIHLRSNHTCPHTPDAVSIVPTNCEPCTAVNSLQISPAATVEDGATVNLVSPVRKAELQSAEHRRGRSRAKSEVAGPDTASPVDGGWGGLGVRVESLELLKPVRFDASKKMEGEGELGWGSAWRQREGMRVQVRARGLRGVCWRATV